MLENKNENINNNKSTNSKIDLGKDNIVKIFLYYAIPAVIGMLAMTSAGIVDGIFIGQFAGPDALAAINISMPILNILFGVGIMVSLGGATLANIKRGEGNKKQSNNYYTITVILVLLLAAIASIIGVFFNSGLATLLGAKADTHNLVATYLGVISFFFIPYLANATLDNFIRNDGFPVFPIVATISGSVINIILDYIFIAKLNLGIGGAAFATGISQLLPMVAMIIFIIYKSTWKIVKPHFELKTITSMLFNGSSELLSNISVGVSGLIFNFIIINNIGTMGVAAYSVANYAGWIAIAIFFGIASAINPGVSFNKGSGDVKRLLAFKKIGILVSFVLGIIIAVALIVFSDALVYMFVSGNTEVHELAVRIINFYAISMVLAGVNVIAAMYYTAINEPVISAIIAGSRSLIALITGVIILPIFFGQNGIWAAIVFAEVVTIIIVLYFFNKKPY